MFSYSYVKSPVSLDRLTQEIQQSSIITALEPLQLDGTSDLTVSFKAELSIEDKNTLDALVANHSGESLESLADRVVIAELPQPCPFTAKTIDNKKLYKRVHGIQSALSTGQNTLLFTIPYPWVKITALQCVGGELLDTASLYILDSTVGTYSGIPNYQLNQFGFTVNVAPEFHEYRSSYDADLYQGMQVKVLYTSVSNKTVGVNFILNEVK
jgi:hypothetical protein